MGNAKSKSDDNSNWRTLRWFWSQTGQTLWKSRTWARKSSNNGVFQTNRHPVCPYLVTDIDTACRILDTKDVDQFVKRDAVGKIEKTGYMKHSLTGSIGDNWLNMRRRLRRDVFAKVFPRKNAPIAKRVAELIRNRFREAVADSGNMLDLKKVLIPLVAIWICELVVGETCTESIRHHFIEHWRFLRRPQHVRKADFEAGKRRTGPKPKTHCNCMLEEIENLNVAPGNDSLVGAMKAAGLTKDAIRGNILSFLAAGFETTLHIIMTTLLMVAHKGSSSQYARTLQKHCAQLCADPAMNRKSIGELKAGKKQSTAGAPVSQAFPKSFSTGSSRLLSRSIVETALKFPPVWDLPRMVSE